MEHTTYHRYNRLVRRGLANPLTHDCGEEFVLMISVDNDTVLHCFACNTKIQPGLGIQNQVKSTVEEFFTPGYTFDGQDL